MLGRYTTGPVVAMAEHSRGTRLSPEASGSGGHLRRVLLLGVLAGDRRLRQTRVDRTALVELLRHPCLELGLSPQEPLDFRGRGRLILPGPLTGGLGVAHALLQGIPRGCRLRQLGLQASLLLRQTRDDRGLLRGGLLSCALHAGQGFFDATALIDLPAHLLVQLRFAPRGLLGRVLPLADSALLSGLEGRLRIDQLPIESFAGRQGVGDLRAELVFAVREPIGCGLGGDGPRLHDATLVDRPCEPLLQIPQLFGRR